MYREKNTYKNDHEKRLMKKTLVLLRPNKCADQTVQLHSLISTFVARCLHGIITALATTKSSPLKETDRIQLQLFVTTKMSFGT